MWDFPHIEKVVVIGKTEVSWFSGDEQPHRYLTDQGQRCDYPLFSGDEQRTCRSVSAMSRCDYPLFSGDEQLVFTKCLFLKTDVATRPLINIIQLTSEECT